MGYRDKINSPFMYILGGIVAAFVLIQSAVFLIRAYRQGIKMGMDKKKLNGAIKSSALFSIVPSIPIVIGVFTLMQAIGVPMAWIRLSVIGAVTYELPAAESAAAAAGMTGLTDPNFNMDIFAGVVLTMSVGIIIGLVLCVVNGVKLVQKKMDKMQNTDRKWGEMFVGALFMGLVATFFGSIVMPPLVGLVRGTMQVYDAVTSILVLVTSAVLMLVFTTISKKSEKLKWVEQFALPVAMVISMVLAVVYYSALGGSI
ncbi:MAG: DUF5058 family protein [Clostridia bacterium]|nr:DUF5058 family protein [Clostridia bacterium]